MSYDVYLVVQTGPAASAVVFESNHTSNTSPMWRAAGCDLAEAHGKTAPELAAQLTRAVADMESRPEHYRPMNPANGWGSYDTALTFLRELLAACELHTFARVEVSR